MKILLVQPPSGNIIRESLPAVVEDETGFFPPLGLLYIASYLKQKTNAEVLVLDCNAEGLSEKDIYEKAKAFSPDISGINVMSFLLPDAIRTAVSIKKACPKSFLVMGGPHPGIYPKETYELGFCDAVCVGEGEISFYLLVKAIMSGKSPDKIPGIYTGKEGFLPQKFIIDLDALPFPDRSLVNQNLYQSSLTGSRRVSTMISSRGCPGKCIFCNRPHMGNIFRKRSAENVVSEMKMIKENGISDEIIFYDDSFNIDSKRVFEICNLIQKEGLEISWDIRARADFTDKKMLVALKKSGCKRIHFGVETGSEKLQKRIGKNLDLNKTMEVFKYCRTLGIETLGYFMFGLPGESHDEIKKTMDFMLNVPMDYAHIAILTPYPATRIYEDGLKSGFYENDFWREFAENPESNFRPRFWDENFSEKDLHKILSKAYKRFYMRPSYLFRRIRKTESMGDFFQKAFLGLKLIRSSFR